MELGNGLRVVGQSKAALQPEITLTSFVLDDEHSEVVALYSFINEGFDRLCHLVEQAFGTGTAVCHGFTRRSLHALFAIEYVRSVFGFSKPVGV